MIDFGLVCLVVLLVSMTGVCGFAYLSIRREIDALRGIDERIDEAITKSTEAKDIAQKVDVEQYQQLAKKIFSQDEKMKAWERTFAGYEEDFKTLNMKLAALKRWRSVGKKSTIEQDDTDTPDFDVHEDQQIDLVKQANTMEDMGIRADFGKKRKVG